jgi:hypothetical protein
MGSAEQEQVGKAKIESGIQFYYTSNCDQHLASTKEAKAGEEVPEWIDDRTKGDSAVEQSSNESEKAEESAKTESQSLGKDDSGKGDGAVKEGESEDGKWDFSNKEPTCSFDKETAAIEELEPCPNEFYDANPSLR